MTVHKKWESETLNPQKWLANDSKATSFRYIKSTQILKKLQYREGSTNFIASMTCQNMEFSWSGLFSGNDV